ncbi:MAG: peptidase S41 [Flavobacteriaceae bacterium]|nr:peptidase S41 [Flavobacteriaceae bacterium]
MKKTLLLLGLVISTLLVSCFEDLDDNIQVASTESINDFIWRGLNFFYLYKTDRPELADNYPNETDFNAFLDSFETPEDFFAFLKSPQDRFSILVDDYIALENALAGTTDNNGMEYGLVLYPDGSGNVFGYVRYVLPNTSASFNNMSRGQIFNTVDGVQITETNFNELLSPNTYTIGLATYDGENVTPTGEEITLDKAAYTENPIFETQTFDINGQKIGYLMYNAFTNEFDSELNAAFGQFNTEGVTSLVLDLRYNSGGSVRSATYLSSMIAGQLNGQIFYTEQWNPDRQPEYAEDGLFVNSFVNGGETINSLDLSEVYILTTGRTASASELVINGLAPYINVVQIGGNTTGKYQASFILYDAPAPNFSRNEANTGHTYALLPLVFQTANAAGNTDFEDGLIPDIEQVEDYSNLGTLGDPTEPLLATAISEITGIPMPGSRKNIQKLEVIAESKSFTPAYQLMLVEK